MMNLAPMVPTVNVKNAPAINPNRTTLRWYFGCSMLTMTSTPTWMPVRTPFPEQGPEPAEYHKYLGTTINLVPPKNLPYGLDIWAPKKVLNIEWNDHGDVLLVSFKPGAW